METEVSLPCLQQPTTYLYSEPDEYSQSPFIPPHYDLSSALFCDITQRVELIPYRRFATTYYSIFKVEESKKSLIKMFYIIVMPILRSCKLFLSFRFHHQNTLPPPQRCQTPTHLILLQLITRLLLLLLLLLFKIVLAEHAPRVRKVRQNSASFLRFSKLSP